MAYKLISGASRENAIKLFGCETAADRADVLAKEQVSPLLAACYMMAGSEKGKLFMLLSSRSWEEQP